MSNTLPNVFETLSEYSASDIYKIIMQGYYYPGCFVLHAIFIVLNLRTTTPKAGVSWYRSFIVGYLMTAGSRHVLSSLTDRKLTEFEGMASIKTFAIVWALLNCCPFDLVYKFANRKSSRVVFALLDSFSQAQNVYQSTYSALMVFDGKPLRVFTIIMCCVSVPLIVDVLDRLLFGNRRFPMAYQFNSIKRNLFIVGALILVGAPGIFEEGVAIIGMGDLTNYTCAIYVLLTILELIILKGRIFYTYDFFMRGFWQLFTYYPKQQIPAEKKQ